MKRGITIAAAAVGAILPAVSAAHTLTAPAVVHANADGSFEVSAVFQAGPGSAMHGSVSWNGSGNVTPLGGVADCICPPFLPPGLEPCVVPEGETLSNGVHARLLDPKRGTTIHFTHELCSAPALQAETIVVPAGASVPFSSPGAGAVLAGSLGALGLAVASRGRRSRRTAPRRAGHDRPPTSEAAGR